MARSYCIKHGLTLSPQTFRDLGSGFTGANVKRGALGHFISLVERGRIPRNAILLIERWDRYGRLSPYDQIAAILGSSVGAVKANFFHALANLKKLLK